MKDENIIKFSSHETINQLIMGKCMNNMPVQRLISFSHFLCHFRKLTSADDSGNIIMESTLNGAARRIMIGLQTIYWFINLVGDCLKLN